MNVVDFVEKNIIAENAAVHCTCRQRTVCRQIAPMRRHSLLKMVAQSIGGNLERQFRITGIMGNEQRLGCSVAAADLGIFRHRHKIVVIADLIGRHIVAVDDLEN